MALFLHKRRKESCLDDKGTNGDKLFVIPRQHLVCDFAKFKDTLPSDTGCPETEALNLGIGRGQGGGGGGLTGGPDCLRGAAGGGGGLQSSLKEIYFDNATSKHLATPKSRLGSRVGASLLSAFLSFSLSSLSLLSLSLSLSLSLFSFLSSLSLSLLPLLSSLVAFPFLSLSPWSVSLSLSLSLLPSHLPFVVRCYVLRVFRLFPKPDVGQYSAQPARKQALRGRAQLCHLQDLREPQNYLGDSWVLVTPIRSLLIT